MHPYYADGTNVSFMHQRGMYTEELKIEELKIEERFPIWCFLVGSLNSWMKCTWVFLEAAHH